MGILSEIVLLFTSTTCCYINPVRRLSRVPLIDTRRYSEPAGRRVSIRPMAACLTAGARDRVRMRAYDRSQFERPTWDDALNRARHGDNPFKIGVPTGIRTPVLTVKGWCPRPLDDGDAGRSNYNKQRKSKSGGARRDRTADLLHAMQALSQLSYGPTWRRGTLPERSDFVKKMKQLRCPRLPALCSIESTPRVSPALPRCRRWVARRFRRTWRGEGAAPARQVTFPAWRPGR
jgi:hypothetical protein